MSVKWQKNIQALHLAFERVGTFMVKFGQDESEPAYTDGVCIKLWRKELSNDVR